MSRFITYAEILDGKLPSDFGVSVVKGSSLTIPGQGSDLAQIIASIVKLPPLDERTFDSPSGEDPDIRSLAVKTEFDSMYLAEGKNLAEDASERQKARRAAKEASEEEKKDERSDDAAES